MTRTERLAALKQTAAENQDFDLYTFYSGIEYDFKRLRAVGRAVKRLYDKGNEDAWNALFDALFDAEGLLTSADLADEDDEPCERLDE